jgi:hypothetical protein
MTDVDRVGNPPLSGRADRDRAPTIVGERSEGTAAAGRRDLDEGRARSMDDREEREGPRRNRHEVRTG